MINRKTKQFKRNVIIPEQVYRLSLSLRHSSWNGFFKKLTNRNIRESKQALFQRPRQAQYN